MKSASHMIHRLLLVSTLIFSQITHAATTENKPLITFAIAGQRLTSALITLSKQSHLPIIFQAEITQHKMAPPLYKTLTLEQALTELLAQSGLFFSIVNNNFIIITKQPAVDDTHKTEHNHRYPPGLEQVHIYGQYVTGSRLARTDYAGATPVEVLLQPQLELRGAVTVGEKLKFLPAVSGNPTSTAVTNGGDGTATVTLRGLPANNTLVLINGRRVTAGGLKGEAIDLNTIAPAAIDRIEILKDGASAIYGADAIAGVVNIVMKDHYDGLLLETFYGETSRGDMETANVNLLWGHNFERASLLTSFTGYKQNGIFSRDRRQSANADGRSWGGTDARSSATPAARIALPNGQTVILKQNEQGQYLDASNPANFRPATDEDLYNYSTETAAFVPHEHKSAYASLQVDLSDKTHFFLDTSFDQTRSQTMLASTPFCTAFALSPITVSADNPYNPFNVPIEDIRRRLVEMPVRNQVNGSTTRRITTGLNGMLNRWSWEAFYSWSKNEAEEKLTHLVDANKAQRALGDPANCTGDCVPLNVFGPPGSITADQINAISTYTKIRGFSELSTSSVNFVGPLLAMPAGVADLAAGIEYREQATSKKTRLIPGQGPTIGGASSGYTRGSRFVTDAYIETHLPLINNKALIKNLALNLSARHSHYSDFGKTTTPKIGLTLRPDNALLFRSTWSKGFRAPSLNELYKIGAQHHPRLVDPCSMASNVGKLPGCTQQSDSNRSQYLTQFNGNDNLKPERSINKTIGVLWSPHKLPGLTASIDMFQIKQRSVIDANAQHIVNQNAITGAYSHLVKRNNNGEIVKIIAQNLNIGKREIKGLDLSSRYQFTSKQFGRFAVAFNASHIHSYIIQPNRQTPTRNIAGTFVDDATDGVGAIPKWKANIGFIWQRSGWQGTYTIHYVDAMRETVPETTTQRTISSWTTHDIQLGYTFDNNDNTRLLIGIDNVFDYPPPRVASGFNDNLDARTHELKGRFLYLKLSQAF